jgi:hypothetical protein
MSGDEPRPANFRQEALEMGGQQLKLDLAVYEQNTRRSLESVRAGNASGTEAIKAATLINGGAAVAMLAFIGHLASINAATASNDLALSLFMFVAGTWLGVVASGTAYIFQITSFASLQHEFAGKEAKDDGDEKRANSEHERSNALMRRGMWINAITVLLVTTALILFAWGCCSAYHVFKSGLVPSANDQPTVSRSFNDIF